MELLTEELIKTTSHCRLEGYYKFSITHALIGGGELWKQPTVVKLNLEFMRLSCLMNSNDSIYCCDKELLATWLKSLAFNTICHNSQTTMAFIIAIPPGIFSNSNYFISKEIAERKLFNILIFLVRQINYLFCLLTEGWASRGSPSLLKWVPLIN